LKFNSEYTLHDYQKRGIDFLTANKYCLLADDCISGEAAIKYNRGGNGKRLKLKDLYTKFHSGKWRSDIPTKTATLREDNSLRLSTIKNIVKKGLKEVWQVEVLAGDKEYSVQMTPDHRVCSESGWAPLNTLQVGSKIRVNGLKYCKVCKTHTEHITYRYSKFRGECKPCMYSDLRRNTIKDGEWIDKDGYVLISGMRFHPYKENHNAVRQHALVYEAFINHMTYIRYLKLLRSNEVFEGFKFIDTSKMSVHHKNRNRSDNEFGNLELMTKSEHASLHAKARPHPAIMSHLGVITKITKGLEAEVYDITMDGSFPSFVADGVVVHNCGIGKSVQSLYAASLTGKKILVVCPSYLKKNWQAEIDKFFPNTTCKMYKSTRSMCPTDHHIVIISYSQLAHGFKVIRGRDVVIFDEVHYLKSPTAQRTEYAHALLDDHKPEYMFGLSGTPIKNRIGEFYTVLGLCSYRARAWEMDVMRDFGHWEFQKEFSHASQLRINGRTITKFSGTRNIPKLKQYLKGKYLRRKAEDILELPPLIEKEVIVDFKETSEFKSEWQEFMAGKGGHISSAKRDVAIFKAKFTAEYVKNLRDDTGKPVLVFTDHPDVTEFIKRTIPKYKCAVITGATPMDMRHRIIDDFQNGVYDFLLATIGSASTGFNITATSNVVFNDMAWVGADNYQAYKRVHRIGQSKTVVVHYILGGKIDLLISRALRTKDRDLKKIL